MKTIEFVIVVTVVEVMCFGHWPSYLIVLSLYSYVQM